MKKVAPKRTRPNRMVTLDPTIVEAVMDVGKKLMPPVLSLSRILDEGMVLWLERHHYGNSRAAKPKGNK